MSNRPVYIPPAKRMSGSNSGKPQKRFHGAFTGGFSAGYFNTVNTKEGWKPSNQKRKDQRLEDFMDDQDHEEWGGPTKVRQDYQENTEDSTSSAARPGPAKQTESLDTLLRVSYQSVGPRLLRKLGWREEGKAAFVPMGRDEQVAEDKKEDDKEAHIVLSSKRLKKIRLQTNRFQIPPPKMDDCGLGFEPHLDAPEFRAFRERRKQLAKERGSVGGSSSGVYRASTLTDDKGGDQLSGEKGGNDGEDYLDYETTEDFIGKKSVGGFALRDDEDDAYDNTGKGGKPSRDMLGDEYNMEIYEHQDSDNEESAEAVTFDPSRAQLNDRGLLQRKTDLGSVLSSWANTSNTTTKAAALMSNGKPPLDGFLLGGSINSHKKRYPGPDIPRDYIIKRHVFGENEHPLIFQTIARAVKLQEREQQRQKMNKQSLPPLAGSKNFFNLAEAMKSRFTTSKTEDNKPTGKAGLSKPDPLISNRQTVKDVAPTNVPTAKKPIVLKRTTQSFLPHPLLCKRFGVPVPKNAVGISMNASMVSSNQPSRVTEANYFDKEIMSVQENNKLAKQEKRREQRSSGVKGDAEMEMEQDADGLQRPSMEKLKSIFEPDSDTDDSSSTDLDASSDEDEGEKEEQPEDEIMQRAKDIVANAMGAEKPSSETPLPDGNEGKEDNKDDKSVASSSASSADSRRRERRHKRKSSHRKHSSSRRRKRSRSPEDADDDEDRRRRKERKRKHDRKKHDKKKKSSRQKRDTDRLSFNNE